MDEIGPMKYFRSKQAMWDFLATKINENFRTQKTGTHVSKRYDAVIRKKKDDVDKNRKSGTVRGEVEYEDEINEIATADDSIEPEVLRGINSVKYKEKKVEVKPSKPRWDKPNKKQILSSLSEAMHSIEKRRLDREEKKEQRRVERHEQFMEVLRSFKKN